MGEGIKFKFVFSTALLMLLFIPLVVPGQNTNFKFKQISFEQGLPSANVRKLFQDRDGIIWIAVEATGLCRYDGHNFRLYKNIANDSSSLPSNFVNDICEDKTGNIWVATEDGVCYFTKKDRFFRTFVHQKSNPNSLSDNLTYTVIADQKNNIWVGTKNGLSKIDNLKNIQHYFFNLKTFNEQNTISVYSIFNTNDGYLWLGTSRGLIKFDSNNGTYKQWEKLHLSDNEPVFNQILDIKKGNNDILWIATHRGLDRFDLKNEEFIHWKYNSKDCTDLTSQGIYSVFIDKYEKVWVGTYTMGIVVIDQKDDSYIRIRKDDGGNMPLKSDHIRFIFADKTGIIWVGTKFEGLFKFTDNESVFRNWPSKYALLQKIKNKHVLSFYSGKNNVCWVGSKYEGLFEADLQQQQILNYKHIENQHNTISSNRIQCIYRDSKNNLWIGTENGLNLMDEKNKTFKKIYNNTVYKILEDVSGTLWLGTSKGIFIYDYQNKILKRYSYPNAHNMFRNEDIEILFLDQDSKHYLWFSTRNEGLLMFHPQTKETRYFTNAESNNDGLGDNMPRKVYEDKNGKLWIGTKSKGLKNYNRETKAFTTFDESNGLPSNLVLGIEEDNYSNLWIATYNGLCKFNTNNFTYENYNSDYGLRSNISELGTSWRFNEGYLFFGGNDGFNIFDPKDIVKQDVKADVAITSIRIFDKEIAMDITQNTEIELRHKQNYISFEFTLTDYKNPHRHLYTYFLKGVDKEWKEPDNYNIASYTSLQPGEYFFSVNGTDELGNWSKKPVTIKIIIKPPFYSTWLFRLILFLFICFLAYGIYLMKTSQIRERRNFLEVQVKERTQKLEDAYQQLLAKNQMIEEKNNEIETHRLQLEATVTDRTRDLELAKKRAEDSDKLKSSFLANMSHEIRTPLNAIIGFSFLLNDHSINDNERENYLKIINNNTNSLLKLIEDILDISKIEAGQLTIKKDLFDLNALFFELYSMFKEELRSYKKNTITIICDNCSKDAPYFPVLADQLRVRQIMINLLSNAVKYTNAGNIEFGYKVIQNDVELFVTDSGIGISHKDQEIIFNQFVKVEEPTSAYRGTGLGLSIAKSLVEMMGGKIVLESKLSSGSCFRVYLPGIVDQTFVSIEKNRINNPEIYIFKDKTILIVEDEESNRQLLQSYLKKSEANIKLASDGYEAIDICRNTKIDVVLMDIKMPRLNGFETIKILKNEFPKLPVIAQTAYAMPEDRSKIFEAGFDNYISKPIKKDYLFELLAGYI